MPLLPGDRRGDALHARAGAAAVRDGERRGDHGRLAVARRWGRRSTCACPARAASATARSAWTWPRTRPSTWPSATAGGCGPPSHYSMGALPLWLWLVGKLPPRVVDVLNAAGPRPARRGWRSGSAGWRRSARSRRWRATGLARAPSPRAAAGAPCWDRAGGAPCSDAAWRRARLRGRCGPAGAGAALDRHVLVGVRPGDRARGHGGAHEAGYAVELPPRTVCCGLTWTSTGQVATPAGCWAAAWRRSSRG